MRAATIAFLVRVAIMAVGLVLVYSMGAGQ